MSAEARALAGSVPRHRFAGLLSFAGSSLSRGAATAFVLQVAGAGFGFLSQLVLARWMRLSSFGTYSYLLAWTNVLALIAGLGLPVAAFRFVPQYRGAGDAARLKGFIRAGRWGTAVAGFILGLVAYGVLAFTRPHGFSGGTGVVLLALMVVPLRAIVNLDSAVVRGVGGITRAYGPSLVLRPLLLVVTVSAAWLIAGKLTTLTAVALAMASFAGAAAVQRGVLHRSVTRERRQRLQYDIGLWTRVSLPLLLVASFLVVLNQADLLIIGALRGIKEAAIYSVVSTTASLVGYVITAVSVITSPGFAQLHARGDHAGMQALASRSAQLIFWPTLLIAAGLASMSTLVLQAFGVSFVNGRSALYVLLLGQIISAACGSVGWLMSMTGHQTTLAKVSFAAALLNVSICYLGARLGGLTGAAWGTTISIVIWNVWLVRLTRRRLAVNTTILSSMAKFVSALRYRNDVL